VRIPRFSHRAALSAKQVAPAPTQAGLHMGIVIGAEGAEIHTEDTGSVRVQLLWDRLGRRDATSGRWARVAQRCTAQSMLFPRIGWHVLTSNEEGSADVPLS